MTALSALRSKGGFTLVEILVAMGVAAVLVGIVFNVSLRMIDRSRSAACLGNLRQLGMAMTNYLADNRMIMPDAEASRASRDEEITTIDVVLRPYVDDEGLFHCPADKSVFAKTGSSYFWNSMLRGQSALQLNLLKTITDLTRIPVMLDKEGWHLYSPDRVNILYADGHASEDIRFIIEE